MLSYAQKKLLVLSSLGGVLEYYDFIIYALFAPYIADQFFPSGNMLTSLLATFAAFAVGHFVRPLGGIIFGHYGDKHGRKGTFSITILALAISTLLIGFIPAYSKIGMAAPIILTLLRIIQGLAMGGEIPGAIAYVAESIPDRKGWACGIISFSLLNGAVFGALSEVILKACLTKYQLFDWGWRLPFIFGGVLGYLSYELRKQLEESPLFCSLEKDAEAFPLAQVFKQRFGNAVAAIFVSGLGATIFTLLFLFVPAYLSNVLHQSTLSYTWYKTLAIFLSSIFCVFFGYLADSTDNKKLLNYLCLLTAVCAYPIFAIYSHHFSWFIISLLLTALLTGYSWALIPSLLSEFFPTAIRYSGIALSYNIGVAFFGGLTPLLASYIIMKTSIVASPFIYLLGAALLCSIALIFAKCYPLSE